MKRKYFIYQFILIIVFQLTYCQIAYCQSNNYKIIFTPENNNLSFDGYYFDKNNLVICLYNNTTDKREYFKYEKEKLVSINEDVFKSMNLKIYKRLDDSTILLLKKENEKISKYYSEGIQYKEGSYIIALEEEYQVEELYIYDNQKLTKINLGNISAIVAYAEAHLYYDKLTDKLFFSGYKLGNKQICEHTDFGLYEYDFKNKKVNLLHKGDLVIAPIRIPKTDYLLYLFHINNIVKEIYIRKINQK